MESIRQELLSFSVNNDDDGLILEIESMSAAHGVAVYQSFFKLFTELEFTDEGAIQHWRALLAHRKEMFSALGRETPLVSVLVDYFSSQRDLLHSPKIVEISAFEKTANESTHDSLTGLFNRQYFKHALEHQLALAKRYSADLSLLFIDGDDFKEVNDRFGHLVGDEALKAISSILREAIRESDIAARYGGEEFVVVMPQTNSLDALILADRIRQKIEEYSLLVDDEKVSLTISGGIASFPANADTAEELIYLADSALYRAKGAGKNNISLFKDDKRRFLRINFSQPVKIKELGFSANKTYSGVSKDICVGGILFENEKQLDIGKRVQISVPIGEGEPLLLIGTVVRVEIVKENRFDIGVVIAFKEMDKVAKSEISRFLLDQVSRP